jgi:hypothetical protein
MKLEFLYRFASEDLKHDELFAACVGMSREFGVRRIPHDGSGASDLVTDSVEHASMDARHRRRRPLDLVGVNDHTFGEVCV